MKEALTMDQILDNEDRREATQLSVDDWVARARVAKAEVKRLKAALEGEQLHALRERKLAEKAEAANAKLVEALNLLLFLHQCEQEALGRPPTPSEWMTAVDKGNAAIEAVK